MMPTMTTAPGLSFLWLEITDKCNLTCTHCYAESGPHRPLYGRMGDDDWLRAIDEAAALGCRQVQFIGGEPTLHPSLDRMIERARQHGFTLIEVYTNATTLTEKRLRYYRENDVQLACSFYSPDAATHDAITLKPGSFEKTVDGIQRAMAFEVPLRVGYIEMAQNKGQYAAACDYLSDMGIGADAVGMDHARAFGNAVAVTAPATDSAFGDLCGQCWKGSLCITANGDAFPCIMGRKHSVGNLVEEGSLTAIVADQALRRFRRDMAQEQGIRLAFAPSGNMVFEEPEPETLEMDGRGHCSPNSATCRPRCSPASCHPKRKDAPQEQVPTR